MIYTQHQTTQDFFPLPLQVALKTIYKPYDSSFEPGNVFMAVEVGADSLNYVLEDLEPATGYQVYVVAATSEGWGEMSQYVEGWTTPPSGS